MFWTEAGQRNWQSCKDSFQKFKQTYYDPLANPIKFLLAQPDVQFMLMSMGMPYGTPWAGLGAAARTTTIGVDTAEAEVANRMVGPGTFTSEDIALGVHENLQAFKGSAKIGSSFPSPHGLWNAITNGLKSTVANGGRIRFNLDGVDVNAAFNPSSKFYGTYTSRELRYVMDNYPESTTFYSNGSVVSPPSP